MLWEVDEFLGDNAGLVVAEIELSDADQAFERPDWLGEEVSQDPRYFNSALSQAALQPLVNPARPATPTHRVSPEMQRNHVCIHSFVLGAFRTSRPH